MILEIFRDGSGLSRLLGESKFQGFIIGVFLKDIIVCLERVFIYQFIFLNSPSVNILTSSNFLINLLASLYM